MIRFSNKYFSIESGSPEGRSPYNFKRKFINVLANPGTVVGAGTMGLAGQSFLGGVGLGLGISIITGLMINEIKHRLSEKKRIAACTMENALRLIKNKLGEDALRRLVIDRNPESTDVSFALENGVCACYINSTHPAILKTLNDTLKKIIKKNDKFYYTSKRVKKGYLVTYLNLTLHDFRELVLVALDVKNEAGNSMNLTVNCILTKTLNNIYIYDKESRTK